MEYKGGTKAAPLIYDGSSISFLDKKEENIQLHSDKWEQTDFFEKGVKQDITEDYGEYQGEEYIYQHHVTNTENGSWKMLSRWIIFGICFGTIMGCCFGKRTIWTWLRDSKQKRLKRLKKMSRISKPQASSSAPPPTVLAVEPVIHIMPPLSKSALESKPSSLPASSEQIELESIAATSSQY